VQQARLLNDLVMISTFSATISRIETKTMSYYSESLAESLYLSKNSSAPEKASCWLMYFPLPQLSYPTLVNDV
jgi:hypothetical protein